MGTGYRERDEMDWKMLLASWYENEEKGYIPAYRKRKSRNQL